MYHTEEYAHACDDTWVTVSPRTAQLTYKLAKGSLYTNPKCFVSWWLTAHLLDIIITSTEEIPDGTYLIVNVQTKHYVFQDGELMIILKDADHRGDEGGWLQSPKVVGADIY